MTHRIGFDIGGTFTDLVLIDAETGAVTSDKVRTVPSNLAGGVVDGIRDLADAEGVSPEEISHVSHGTTVATNALLEQEGVSTGLITTEGFRDIVAIGRERRSELYNYSAEKTPTFVERRHRNGITERISATGDVETPLDEASVEAAVDDLVSEGVESVAVCLLNAYRNPVHERRIEEIVASRSDLSVTVSSDVMPEIKEYERTLSTIINAYVEPLITDYVRDLTEQLRAFGIDEPLHVMQANGGVIRSETLDERSLQLINSGPAAGVIGAKRSAAAFGIDDIITLDIGGTSADASIVRDGEIETTTEGEIDDLPLLFPQIDVRAVGAGGGSIAWLNQVDVLKVGPKSAGADPGPACYGYGGTEPTVTDAAAVLGYFDPGYFLGGKMDLDVGAAEAAIERVQRHLEADPLDVAAGIVDIATTNMAQAIRLTTIEKGYDPRGFTLTTYGGAGPMFATQIAEKLEIDGVFVPPNPGVLSAFGLLSADERFDFSVSRPMSLDPANADEIDELYETLNERAAETAGTDYSQERSVDVRYEGQRYEQNVPVPDGRIDEDAVTSIRSAFVDSYESIYGYTNVDDALEGVTWRLAAVTPTPDLGSRPETGAASVEDAHKGTRTVYTGEEHREYDVYDRFSLPTDATVDGPAVVEEAESTTIVTANYSFTVGEYGGLSLERR
ncbi:hydantoinase/oxoprolinase family protein [Halovivax cerinus]|uniref:Hydantoinase/oxoprolinase family protein n=1 Tax=Halovivax cerinus TaxID=1487865 RepID=A0ABD5NQ39_9EURY|nr:hydantoinase/oxoprolinase family protein [Halovivax cerinus]